MGMEYCLLTEKLLSVRFINGNYSELSLPEVFAELTLNNIDAFTTLQRHQQHPWHAFLVQLAAIALHQNSLGSCSEPGKWMQMLLDLTSNSPEAWSLVVSDLAKPALMQSPIPEGSLEKYKSEGNETPDAIDILNTAKNHDLKLKRISKPSPSHWLYALVTLQTMQGFLGRGNYGISRMNGGFASRPCVTYQNSVLPGEVFMHDVSRCLKFRDRLVTEYEFFNNPVQHKLLWLIPWDGKKSMEMNELDPFFIEVCRRVRLCLVNERIVAFSANTEASLLASKELNGRTGDPWTPVNKGDAKAFTASEKGFDYQTVSELIFSGTYRPGIAQEIESCTDEAFFWGSVMVRGQGTTSGFHERKIRIPSKARKMLGCQAGMDSIGRRSKTWVDVAGTARKNVFLPSVMQLLNGDMDKAMKWLQRFNSRVDQVFFPQFWETIEMEDEQARVEWEKKLLRIGEKLLQMAMLRLPVPVTRYFKLCSKAESMYFFSARKNFKHDKQKETSNGSR